MRQFQRDGQAFRLGGLAQIVAAAQPRWGTKEAKRVAEERIRREIAAKIAADGKFAQAGKSSR